MLKIAMIAGPIAYTVALCKALSRYCAIDLYCGHRYAGREDPAIFSNLPSYVKPILYKEYRKRDPRNIIAQYKLCRMLKTGEYDLIHLQYEWEWSVMIFWSMLKKIPLVFTVHDPYQHVGYNPLLVLYMDMLQGYFINRAKRIIVHGNTMKKSLLQRYHHVKSKDVVSHLHGNPSIVPSADKQAGSGESDGKTILFFGNIRPNKGLPFLVKAEPLIAERVNNFRILIVGRCADPSYKRLIKKPERYVIREEFVAHEAVEGIFRSAAVVVLPYLSATQTGVIPLAFGFGRPVVATSVGGIVDVVKDGETGLLVPPRNEKALADAVVMLLLDNELRNRMGRNARDFADRHLGWDEAARITFATYESIVGHG